MNKLGSTLELLFTTNLLRPKLLENFIEIRNEKFSLLLVGRLFRDFLIQHFWFQQELVMVSRKSLRTSDFSLR